jgi:hypothetical protein
MVRKNESAVDRIGVAHLYAMHRVNRSMPCEPFERLAGSLIWIGKKGRVIELRVMLDRQEVRAVACRSISFGFGGHRLRSGRTALAEYFAEQVTEREVELIRPLPGSPGFSSIKTRRSPASGRHRDSEEPHNERCHAFVRRGGAGGRRAAGVARYFPPKILKTYVR